MIKEVKQINSAAVDQQTIDTLKELLEEAESGRLRSIMFIDRYSNGDVGSGWAGQPNSKMVGELEKLKVIYLMQVIGQEEFFGD